MFKQLRNSKDETPAILICGAAFLFIWAGVMGLVVGISFQKSFEGGSSITQEAFAKELAPIIAPTHKQEREKEQVERIAKYILKYNYKVFPALADLIATSMCTVEDETGVPAEFLLALAQVESSFNYTAVSNADCLGLLQINPEVWIQDVANKHSLKQAGITNSTRGLYDPVINLRAGAHILKIYYMRALKRGMANPLEYALNRYFGGDRNTHYDKFSSALDDYYTFVIDRCVG